MARPQKFAEGNTLGISGVVRLLGEKGYGVSESTVRRWTDQGRIPHYRTLGGTKRAGVRRYRRSEVEDFIHKHIEHRTAG
jgi:excisionase family DNA binding protein